MVDALEMSQADLLEIEDRIINGVYTQRDSLRLLYRAKAVTVLMNETEATLTMLKNKVAALEEMVLNVN